ncbi:MAG: ribosomal RNA small subunit methyltransferase A [Candidatus Aminicenantes bacterium]|nr:ribosomal RNA small subunit methyltransferase A [Candidatus Aminicenantes bacterium]
MKRTKIKALGQHFLKDHDVLKKIIRHISPSKEDLIIEIGAGKGALTFFLAAKAGKVIAIEKDPAFIPFLQKKDIPNLTILEEDILKVNFSELIKAQNFKNKAKLVGNLPYSVSSPLLFKVLQEREVLSGCVFLLQKEVAERICSQPGSKNYAPLSILFQIHFSAKLLFLVPPGSFAPPPKVHSALISLERRDHPLFLIDQEELFRQFLKGAFKHRRKVLRKNLEILNFPLPLIDEALGKFGIERNLRPEQISISQFVSLFNFFYRIEE